MKKYILVLIFLNISYGMKLNHFMYSCESELIQLKNKKCAVVELKGKKLKVVKMRRPTQKKCSQNDSLIGVITEKRCINFGSSTGTLSGNKSSGIDDILNNRKFSVTDPSRTH